MAEILDENRIPVMKALSKNDGATMVDVYIEPISHALAVMNGTTGTDYGPVNDIRDENRKVAFMAVSAIDGITPVPVYIDPTTHSLLIQTT